MTDKGGDAAKTIGQAIDEIIHALMPLDDDSRKTAIRTSCDHLKIPFGPPQPHLSNKGTDSLAIRSTGSTVISDIKTLKEQKAPGSANEMAALVAFYLAELAPEQDRKSEVDLDDMIKYFKQAVFPLPRKPQFLLTNSKNAGYLDAAGSGRYKLNPVGYNLVAHNLPRAGGATVTPARRRKQRAASRKPGASKAKRS